MGCAESGNENAPKQWPCSYKLFLFFFFQAEDGIRDVAVTGVQTCALPISSVPQNVRRQSFSFQGRTFANGSGNVLIEDMLKARACKGLGARIEEPFRNARSEERRVGKECRSRWSPYH